MTVGAGAWVGNCVVGVSGSVATLDLAAGATLALNGTANLGIDTNATLRTVGTGAAARARVTSTAPGTTRYNFVINGTWTAEWFAVVSPDTNGCQCGSTAQITGAPTADWANGFWDWPAANGRLLNLNNTDSVNTTLPGSVAGNVFANTGGTSPASNVSASGTTPTLFFLQATGALAGETNDLEPVGPGPVFWNVGTLNIAVGANTPPARNILPSTNNVVLTQWQVTETGGESVAVSSMTFTATGATANSGNLRLYDDVDGSGTFSVGDQLLTAVAGPAWSGGAVTFTGTPLFTVAANGTKALFLLANVTTATVGAQYGASVAAATDVTGVGSPSGLTAQVTGSFAVAGTLVTVVGSGSVSAVLGGQTAPVGQILQNGSNLAVGQFRLTADALEAQTLNTLTFELGGTGAASALSTLRLFRDVGTVPGVYDAGDVALGTPPVGGVWNTTPVPPQAVFTTLGYTIPAGGSVTLLFVQNVTSATLGNTYRVDLTAVTTTGQLSGATAQLGTGWPTAANTQTVADRGTLVASLGPNTPAGAGVVKTATGRVLTQVQLQPSLGENVTVTQVLVTHVGTATPATAVTAVRLYEDLNGNGAVNVGEPQLGSGTFSGTTATVSLNRTLNAAVVHQVLVVYDLSGNGTAGQTLAARVAAAGSVTATGVTSGLALTVVGVPSFPLTGGTITLIDAPPTLTVSAGAQHPAAGTVSGSATGVVMAQPVVTASGEPITLQSVSVTGSGSANETTAVTGVTLWEDTGTTPGVVDATDTLVAGPSTFTVDNGTVVFGGLTLLIGQGNSRTFLVAYDFNAAGVTNGQTVAATVTAVAGTGQTSGNAAATAGVPLAGNVQTVAVGGSLSVTAGARNPVAQTVPSGTTRVPVCQVSLQPSAAEDVRVTRLTLTQTGAPAGFFRNVLVYRDANGDGLLQATDPLLVTSAGTVVGAVTPQVSWPMSARLSAGATFTWLVVADVQGALGTNASLTCAAGGLQVRGMTSGLTETSGLTVTGLPVGGGVVTLGLTGSVTTYLGTQTSPARTELPGTTGVPAAQFTLRASPAEAATLTSVTFTASGTGDDVNDLAAVNPVKVTVDANNNGAVDAGETLLGQGVWSADNGTLALTGLTQTIPAGADLHLLVTLDLDTPVTTGLTFAVGISRPPLQVPPLPGHVQVTGQVSSAALTVSGEPVTGNAVTVQPVGGLETLAVQAGVPWPAPSWVPPSSLPATNVPALVLRLTTTSVGPVWVSAVTFTPSGTGNDATVTVRVFADTGSVPGKVDATDTLLGTGSYPGNNQPWVLTFAPKLQLTAGTTTPWLVTHTVSSGSQGDTFEVRLAPTADLAADDNTATPTVQVTGGLLQGPTLTLASPPSLQAAAAPFTKGSSGGGCFVATAAAGEASGLVAGLTTVRDGALPTGVVTAYYRWSPPVAAAVGADAGLAAAVRGGLAPWAGLGTGGAPWALLALGLLAALAAVTLRRRPATA